MPELSLVPSPTAAAPHGVARGALFRSSALREPFVSVDKVPGSLRIVVVGDSMTYGQGLPYSRTMAQRLSAHLNGALPDIFVDAIALGTCGACLFHALERVDDQALLLKPDVLIVAACANDAYMLRSQPTSNEAIGETWVAFRPHLERRLAAFAGRMRVAGAPRAAVLYFDRRSRYGSVSPSQVLRDICASVGVPFIDASEALAGYSPESLTVSSADGHLNALAHDVVARLVARSLADARWLPEAAPYGSPAWLQTMTRLPQSLAEAGVPPLMAGARTLAVTQRKWTDRRNRTRSEMGAAYALARSAIAASQRVSLESLAWNAMGRWLSDTHHPEGALAFCEARLHELSTVLSALEYAAHAGDVEQDVDELATVIGVGDGVALPEQAPLARIAAARAAIDRIAQVLPDDDAEPVIELRALHSVVARVGALLLMLERSATRHDALQRAAITPTYGTSRLFAYALRALHENADRLVFWIDRLPWRRVDEAAASWDVASPSMTLSLVVAVDPGDETLRMSVGVEALYPFYQQTMLHTANLIRDGRPHAYELELPLMILGDIYVHVAGPTSGRAADADPLRVYTATLTADGQPAKTLPPRAPVSRSAAGSTLVYRSVFLFEE